MIAQVIQPSLLVVIAMKVQIANILSRNICIDVADCGGGWRLVTYLLYDKYPKS